jgi:hypothetical protein
MYSNILRTSNSPPPGSRLPLTLCVNFSFWLFDISDCFFTGDTGFFVVPVDFLWTLPTLFDDSAIFFAFPLLSFVSTPTSAAHGTSCKISSRLKGKVRGHHTCWTRRSTSRVDIENQQFQRVTEIRCH